MTAHVSSPRGESELLALRKLAEDLAERRGERATTGHLLAAIASRPGPAADLLAERRLDTDMLLRAARVVTDDAGDALPRAVQRAREFALRAPSRDAGALHLLFALCQERASAAYRAIEQCGSDVTKLRTAAMQVAMGIAAPRRMPPPSATTGAPSPRSGTMPVRPPAPSSPPKQLTLTPPSQASRLAPPEITKPMHARPAPPPPVKVPPRKDRHVAVPAAKAKTTRHAHEDRFALDPKKMPLLTQLGKNLTLAAARGELDPVVGREEEIDRTLDVLAKRQANSACLVGPPGVGKTSIVRGLAQWIAAGKDVDALDERIIVQIEPSALLAGTAVRGSLAERIGQLKEEVRSSGGRIVLFFDEIHTLFADAGDEGLAELKGALTHGELVCVGATTREDFRRVLEANPAIARRFTLVEVEEPSPEEAFLALESIAPLFEAHHKAKVAKEALGATITWSRRFLPGRALPDKAVEILDLAGARVRRRGLTEITAEHVAEVVSELAGVPEERLLESDGERMLRLESLLAERIVGHTSALARIAAVLRRNASGFVARRPIGSFLLLGPTGVGKTETAKAIAECLFHSPDAMTRLDLSEYAEPHAIARLVGAPPGYVGHESGGQLTEAVRRRPYQVILLDEIEKAHRDVLEAFLQVFDEGRLTDGRGRTIDFTSTVILLTSNIGADIAVPSSSSRGRIGFSSRAPAPSATTVYEDAVLAAARAALPPELYNRLDEVMAFAPLGRVDVAEVARRMLTSLSEELEALRGVRLDASEAAIELLLDQGGFDPSLGARPMRRAIARLVEAPIAEMILRGEITRGDVVTLDAEEGKIVVDAVTPEDESSPRGRGGSRTGS